MARLVDKDSRKSSWPTQVRCSRGRQGRRIMINSTGFGERWDLLTVLPPRLQQTSWRALLKTFPLVLVLVVGCTTSSGTRFTLCPEGHPLLESTKAIRQTDSPLPLPRELDKHPMPPYMV